MHSEQNWFQKWQFCLEKLFCSIFYYKNRILLLLELILCKVQNECFYGGVGLLF